MGRISSRKCKIEIGTKHLQVWSSGCEASAGESEGGEAVSSGEDICGPEDCTDGGRTPGRFLKCKAIYGVNSLKIYFEILC